jgi:hypothetical protein
MATDMLFSNNMTFEESLQDLTIRQRQLEQHILCSHEYLWRADQELKRQVSMLYLAISLLLVIQGLFTFHAIGNMPLAGVTLITVTSLLAIINCLLLIRTKTCLYRLNEAWLGPQEKEALHAIEVRRHEIISTLPRSRERSENADLN